jgi:uncharacterized protein
VNVNPPGLQPLSEAELDRLAAFLNGIENETALSLEGMDGLFCALIASPARVMPSEYLPIIWGGELPDANAFASLEDANATLSLVMRHWNSIISDLESDAVHIPLVFEPDPSGVIGRGWARGFMRGVHVAPAPWNELFQSETEGQLFAIPLVAGEVDAEWPKEPLTKERSDELLMWMGAGLARSYRHFAAARRAAADALREDATYRRSGPKTGRNDACPCGSGRKFKHCCGVPGAQN